MAADRRDSLAGCLLGTALGDSLGLPFEGLSASKVTRMLGDEPLNHRFLFGRGMVSDDTEHTVLAAQALLRSGGDAERFQRALAWGLRGWFLGFPAGMGLATLRACLKLWAGVPPSRSGVRSAGNGPAMRAAILGVYFAKDLDRLNEFVRRSSVITHTDSRAVDSALWVALAARGAALGLSSEEVLESWRAEGEAGQVLDLLRSGFAERLSLAEFAARLGCGDRVTGYSMRSIPVALYAWLVHRGELERPLETLIRLGGDTDTVGATFGGVCGAEAGARGLPAEWVDGLREWPRSVGWMERLAGSLADGDRPLPVAWPLIPLRNALFLGTVLYHGVRRLV